MGKSWAGNGVIRNANKIFIGNLMVNAHLGDPNLNERIILRQI